MTDLQLPQTETYIQWVFNNTSEKRGGHHNYVIEQRVLNLPIPLDDMSKDEIVYFDVECFKYLYALDDEPDLLVIMNAGGMKGDYEVNFSFLGQDETMVVQLTGGEYLPQMGCQLSFKDDCDYRADDDTDIMAQFIVSIIKAAKEQYQLDAAAMLTENDLECEVWTKIDSFEPHRISATSHSSVIVEESNLGRFRSYVETSGFTQPNDYSSMPDAKPPEYFESLEALKAKLGNKDAVSTSKTY
jgi:hypothetical protein